MASVSTSHRFPCASTRLRRPVVTKGRASRCRATAEERIEAAAAAFAKKGYPDASMLADDFVSFADGVRFVNDISKRQQLEVVNKMYERGDVKVAQSYYAVSESRSDAFVLCIAETGPYAVPIVTRFTVNEDGQICKMWSRRGVVESELDLLLRPQAVLSRMEQAPVFEARRLPLDVNRSARMLAALDVFDDMWTPHSSQERMAMLESITTEDFQHWEGTCVWEPTYGGLQVLNREGVVANTGRTMKIGGDSGPGKTRVLVRSQAASKTSNVGFLHVNILAVHDSNGPVALDLLLAFAFTDSGERMTHAMGLRNAYGLQEYGLTFKTRSEALVHAA